MVRLSGPSGWAGRSSAKLPAELLIGAGFAVIVAATVAAAILFGPHQPVGRLTVLAAAVGGFAAVAGDALAAPVTAVIGWLILNGMLVDQHAVLRWHGTPDVVRLVVLGGVALAGTACAWLVHVRRISVPASRITRSLPRRHATLSAQELAQASPVGSVTVLAGWWETRTAAGGGRPSTAAPWKAPRRVQAAGSAAAAMADSGSGRCRTARVQKPGRQAEAKEHKGAGRDLHRPDDRGFRVAVAAGEGG